MACWRSDSFRNRCCCGADMTGRVKDHYWEEICAREMDFPEPDDLEMLAIDAKQAAERYEAALKKRNEGKQHGPV